MKCRRVLSNRDSHHSGRNMGTLKLDFHLSNDVLDSFLPILEKEYEITGQGFYCNWDCIQLQKKKEQVISLTFNKEHIAFVTWRRENKIIEIETIWILPQFRNKGYGYAFQQLLFKEFKKRGDVAITLSCATQDGLRLAKKCGFIPQYNFGNFSNENIDLRLRPEYIYILKNTEALYYDNADLTILCYEEYHDENSFYCEINLSADFVKKPVYLYVNCEWECKVLLKGRIIYETSMKHILLDLKIRLFNYKVAYIDHNIIIPQYWLR